MKHSFHTLALILSLATFLPIVSSHASLLIDDDFSTSTIANVARLTLGDVSEDWVKNSTSLWTISAGTLSNVGTTAGVPAEGAVLKVFEVEPQLVDYTALTFSFDYTVGTGSTLYFHAIGLYNGTTLAGNTQLHNTGAQNGSIQSQYNDAPTVPRGDFTGVNLFNGAADPNGTPGGAIAFAENTNGTYTQTCYIPSYGIGGVDDINDFQFLTMGFGSNVTDNTGAGTITLDNFSLNAAVPEPSSFFVLTLGVAGMVFRRRRRAVNKLQ